MLDRLRAPEPDAAPRIAPPAPMPSPAGLQGQLLQLQRMAGNQAVVAFLQRQVMREGAPPADDLDLDIDAEGAEGDEVEGEELADEEEVLDEITELTRSEAYTTPDGEQHHAEVHFEGDEVVPGVHSDWTTVESIRRTLTGAAAVAAGVQPATVATLFADVDRLQNETRVATRALRLARERMEAVRYRLVPQAARRGVQRPPRRVLRTDPDRAALRAARVAWSEARRAVTEVTAELAAECRWVHRQAWLDYSDLLGVHLMPAGLLFQDRAFAGDPNKLGDYHEGTASDPIPIVWYKAPTDYPELDVPDGAGRKVVAPFDAFTLGALTFGVAGGNRPRVGWTIQKRAHDGDRGNQQAFNRVFSLHGVKVGPGKVDFDRAGMDGDHVKDLGFGGQDAIDNYWPLDATVNRRAFNGYNSLYHVNYVDTSTGTPVGKTRAIGGLIGYWFVVKAFLAPGDGPVPAESGTAAAGRA